jgi:hypothetical protein
VLVAGDLVSLSAEVTYVLAAAAYGTAVLAKVRDDDADATVSLGRRVLQRVFGTRQAGEPLPEQLADLIADPEDGDAVAALRLAIRKALAADPAVRAGVEPATLGSPSPAQTRAPAAQWLPSVLRTRCDGGESDLLPHAEAT